jgi:hypothetical protein
MLARSASRKAALAGVGACVALFAGWTGAQLGHVPRYFDTLEYARRARSLEADAFRGFLYPALLAAAHRAAGESAVREPFRWSPSRGNPSLPHAEGVYAALQLGQLAVAAASIAYFAWIATGLAGRRLALLTALVALDPLVAHFGLAILTDAPALAASLAFCAALADLAARRPRARAAAACVLPLAAFAATGLRAEKGAVLVATALASAAAFAGCARVRAGARTSLASGSLRGRFAALRAGARTSLASGSLRGRFAALRAGARNSLAPARRIAAALALVAVAVGAAVALQRSFLADSPRWRPGLVALYLRVILPHVGELEELPPSARAALGPNADRLARAPLPRARGIVESASGGDPARREALSRDLARAVLRERGLALALDVAKDALENAAATASFYARLALASAPGGLAARLGLADGVAETAQLLTARTPRLAHAALAAAAALALAATLLALASARARRRAGLPILGAEAAVAWTPALAFCAANAVAFAAAQDLVHVRYALGAHVGWLVAAYAALLRRLLPARAG